MVKLRPYQEDLLQKAERALAKPDARVMLQLPTGGGKTRIAAALLDGWLQIGGKAAWLTHRQELSAQTRDALNDNGVWATNTLVWGVDDPAPSETDGVVIEMVQTVSRRNSYRSVWDEYGPEDLLVIDEAHHAPARGWERTIRQWRGKAVGLTATPWRIEKNLGFKHLFDCLIPGPQISELQAKGYLANAKVYTPDSDGIIIGGRLNSKGEYIEREIELANQGRPGVMTARALEFWQNRAQGRQTIIYAVSVGHAENLAAVFNDADVPAAVILGDTHKDVRDWRLQQFRNGELKVLVNLAVATEGFDLPDASCVVLARPTMSLALYLQMVGRGLRRKPEGADYTDCLILDLAGNYKEHGFPDVEREWSLEPRGQQGQGGHPPVVRCCDCEGVSPASSHSCQYCESPFGQDCDRCGQWRAWKWWNAEDYCQDDHELVCDRCHPDAHILANLPVGEGLKEMLRKEPVDSETKLNLSDLHTGNAARDLLCEVMENLIYAKKVDDTGTFIRILERQLKPLLRKEKQLRNAEIKEMIAEFEAAITPASLEFYNDILEISEGRRRITEIVVSQENGISYLWEENGEVHWSDWSPWSQDELSPLGQGEEE